MCISQYNRWNKKPVHFIAFVEKEKFHIYHWNLLLWAFQYTDQELQTALDKTLKYMNLNDNVMKIQPIEYTRFHLNNYNVKELESDDKFHINSDCIFTSENIHDLNCRKVILGCRFVLHTLSFSFFSTVALIP